MHGWKPAGWGEKMKFVLYTIMRNGSIPSTYLVCIELEIREHGMHGWQFNGVKIWGKLNRTDMGFHSTVQVKNKAMNWRSVRYYRVVNEPKRVRRNRVQCN